MKICLTIISLLSFLCAHAWAAAIPKFDSKSDADHQIQLLEDGSAALEARLQLIENAEQFIILETFIYDIDEAGSWIARALVEKKKQNPNIRIRLLVDSVPMRKTIDAYVDREFKKYGIEVKLYNQHASLNFVRLNVRNHRKIIASEKELITGSRNIANDYYYLAKSNNFIDRDIRIRGPINDSILETFEAFWLSENSTEIKTEDFPNMNDFRSEDTKISYEYSKPLPTDSGPDVYRYNQAIEAYDMNTLKAEVFVSNLHSSDQSRQYLATVRAAGKRALSKQPVFPINKIRFVSDGPDWVKQSETITGTILLEDISKTKSRLMIENGYIIPDSESWKMFKKLMADGKKIMILTNSRKASRREFVVNALTQVHAKNFAANGANIYLYSGDPMPMDENPIPQMTQGSRYNTHAKTYVIDETSCMIGTANFDPRSLRRMNAELALLIDNADFCQHVARMILWRAGNGHRMDTNGEIPPDIDANDVESIQQRLLLLMVPMIRIFERWF